MTTRSRLLGGANSPPPPTPPPHLSSPALETLDSDFVVILAALLCALICVLGLLAVSRCSWIRRLAGRDPSTAAASSRGLKKKVLKSLPKLTYGEQSTTEAAAKLHDCAICLAEFAAGDQVRVLPQCGHGFHVSCIDTWLASHASCPSCRRNLEVAPRPCENCGRLPPATACSAVGLWPEAREGRISLDLYP